MNNNKYCEYYHGEGRCLTGHKCYIANHEEWNSETIKQHVETCTLRKTANTLLKKIVNQPIKLNVK